MTSSLTIEWTTTARFGWWRLPAEVQAGLHTRLCQLSLQYAGYYRQLGDPQQAIQATPVLHFPDWNIYISLQLHYQEDELGPILFLYALDELSKREADAALAFINQIPNRLNKPATQTDLDQQ